MDLLLENRKTESGLLKGHLGMYLGVPILVAYINGYNEPTLQHKTAM